MRKRLLIGVLVPLAASLGLWLGAGGSATANSKHAAVHAPKAAVYASHPSGSDPDNVQSGDQTAPDVSNGESEGPDGTSESEGEATTTETDGVDCQQEGNFEGVNAAGTGPGCDGTGA